MKPALRKALKRKENKLSIFMLEFLKSIVLMEFTPEVTFVVFLPSRGFWFPIFCYQQSHLVDEVSFVSMKYGFITV